MYANHDGELRFTTVVLTVLIIISIIATMTMLGCTDDLDEGLTMDSGKTSSEEFAESKKDEAAKEPEKEKTDEVVKAEEKVQVNEQQVLLPVKNPDVKPVRPAIGGNTGGGTGEDSGSNSDSGSNQPAFQQCPGCGDWMQSLVRPHILCSVCKSGYGCANMHEEDPICGHIQCFVINAYEDGHNPAVCYPQQGGSTIISNQPPQNTAITNTPISNSPAPAPCAKCGIAASSAHFTMGCGHVRCANEQEHSLHPCGVHYSCGDSQVDHWSYYACGHYPCQHGPEEPCN